VGAQIFTAISGAGGITSRPWKSDLQGRVTAPPAPENESCFQGWLIA